MSNKDVKTKILPAGTVKMAYSPDSKAYYTQLIKERDAALIADKKAVEILRKEIESHKELLQQTQAKLDEKEKALHDKLTAFKAKEILWAQVAMRLEKDRAVVLCGDEDNQKNFPVPEALKLLLPKTAVWKPVIVSRYDEGVKSYAGREYQETEWFDETYITINGYMKMGIPSKEKTVKFIRAGDLLLPPIREWSDEDLFESNDGESTSEGDVWRVRSAFGIMISASPETLQTKDSLPVDVERRHECTLSATLNSLSNDDVPWTIVFAN
jgi:hypothetical protein